MAPAPITAVFIGRMPPLTPSSPRTTGAQLSMPWQLLVLPDEQLYWGCAALSSVQVRVEPCQRLAHNLVERGPDEEVVVPVVAQRHQVLRLARLCMECGALREGDQV